MESKPFDDIRKLLSQLPPPNMQAGEAVKSRDALLTKPKGSLGELESLVHWLALWSGRVRAENILVAIFAGNHGVARQGVSPYPSEVTKQMVANFTNGGAAINQICKCHNLRLKVFELSLDVPTKDISCQAAMDERTCAATMAYGMEAIAEPCDVLCLGEMGIANTTVASAIYYALFGGKANEWVGAGTGHDKAGIELKAKIIERAVALHKNNLSDGLEVLRCLGGREIAAMCGAILAARLHNIPVILDGFVAGAAAAVLYCLDKTSIEHCLFSHVSSEQAHKKALAIMEKKSLLDLQMRLGEGTGAALAAGIVRAAAACYNGMATFQQANVSEKNANEKK